MEHDLRKTATETFEQINRGGVNLLVAAQGRLIEAKQALEEGRFVDAGSATASAFAKIEALSTAESALGGMADRLIVKVKDVTVGMILPEVGPIEAINSCSCSVQSCQKIELTIHGESQRFTGDQEMLVQLPSDD